MLTAAQVASMRATQKRALPQTCTIQRLTSVSDGGGGRTESWADIADGVPCRVAPVAGGETGTSGDRIVDESTHVITLPAGEDVTEADRIVVDDQTYNVTLVRRRGPWETSRRVEAKEAG